MSDKKIKFDLDYEQENYKKVNVEPTKAFDVDMVNKNIESEYVNYSTDELNYILENEKLSKEDKNIIKKILESRK